MTTGLIHPATALLTAGICAGAPLGETMMRMRLVTFAVLAWLGICGAAQAADPIKIGAVLPFSGGVELFGAQAKLGLDLAATDINAAGGILGRPVEVGHRDDGTPPHIAPRAAPKVVD